MQTWSARRPIQRPSTPKRWRPSQISSCVILTSIRPDGLSDSFTQTAVVTRCDWRYVSSAVDGWNHSSSKILLQTAMKTTRKSLSPTVTMGWRTLIWAGQKCSSCPLAGSWGTAPCEGPGCSDEVLKDTAAGSVYTDFINKVVGEQFYWGGCCWSGMLLMMSESPERQKLWVKTAPSHIIVGLRMFAAHSANSKCSKTRVTHWLLLLDRTILVRTRQKFAEIKSLYGEYILLFEWFNSCGTNVWKH